MPLGLQPRQAFPTLPGFADLTWPDSCNYTGSLVDSCNAKFTTIAEPTCINPSSDSGCCSSWGSYGSSYLYCLQTEYSSCPGLFATFISEVESQLPCATDFPITSVPNLSFESISTAPPTAPAPHSAVPTYTGSGSLLQDYCATPEYVLLNGPTALWAPIVGCAGGKTDCCPYSVFQETTAIVVSTVTALYTVTVDVGPGGTTQGDYAGFQAYPTPISANLSTLAHCPDDYQTLSGGCCPSGYQLWNAVLGGQVPCYSSLSSYLVPPAVPVTSTTPEFLPFTSNPSSTAGNATVSIPATSPPIDTPTSPQKPTSAVINIVFAIQYNVLPSSTSGLSTGTKAGIGVGASVAGIAIIALSLLLVWKTRKHKRDKKALAVIQATERDPTRQYQSEMTSKTPIIHTTRTELQSHDVNLPMHNPGNIVSQEQRVYNSQQQQQKIQMEQSVQTSGYSRPQQGQYMQQVPVELPFHHQSPAPSSVGYSYQNGNAGERTPRDHFISSTVSAQTEQQGYGYQPNYSTAQGATNTPPTFQQ